jgi:signal peptidase I
MKKKIIISVAVFCSLLTVLWIVGRVTGMFQFYKTPTPSSEPNIKQGENFFSSNLLDPAPYNFIVFTSRYEDSVNMVFMPDLKPGTHYIHRLCGVPGDIIEMRNGTLFINDKNFDKPLNLNIQYKISSSKLALIDEDDMAAMEKSCPVIQNGDSTLVTFDNVLMEKYGSQTNPALYIMSHFEDGPFKWNNKDDQWTTDNFGPLKVPANCYFVVGDNRHNAMDSRYIGFVKKENIKGVVLNK